MKDKRWNDKICSINEVKSDITMTEVTNGE